MTAYPLIVRLAFVIFSGLGLVVVGSIGMQPSHPLEGVQQLVQPAQCGVRWVHMASVKEKIRDSFKDTITEQPLPVVMCQPSASDLVCD
jgi:hypothetical protein